MKVITKSAPDYAPLNNPNVHTITIITDSGMEYDIVETQPDTLQIRQVDKNLSIVVFPVDPQTVEIA